MNGNDMEKKHEHKKEVVNKESTESHEKGASIILCK